jgi:VanZ family protein
MLIFPALRRAIAYVPAIIWAALLVFIGGRSNVPRVESPLPLDKAAHFVMYGVLGALAVTGWKRAGRKPGLLLVLVLASLVGASDEVHQASVPGRSSEVADWIADTLGIAAAALLIRRFTQEKNTNVARDGIQNTSRG